MNPYRSYRPIGDYDVFLSVRGEWKLVECCLTRARARTLASKIPGSTWIKKMPKEVRAERDRLLDYLTY